MMVAADLNAVNDGGDAIIAAFSLFLNCLSCKNRFGTFLAFTFLGHNNHQFVFVPSKFVFEAASIHQVLPHVLSFFLFLSTSSPSQYHYPFPPKYIGRI